MPDEFNADRGHKIAKQKFQVRRAWEAITSIVQ